MTRILSLAALVTITVASSLAHADDIYRDPNDPGRVTYIGKGVWELEAVGLGVLSTDSENGTSVTQVSADASLQVHYFLKDNISVGVEGLFDYDTTGSGNGDALAFGAAVDATAHLRLGLGAFFRPGIAIGAVFGNRNLPQTDGTVEQASEVGFVTRLQLPIAYFASRRLLLQAGPQLNMTFGSYTPTGGDAVSFTHIAGGFAIGFGYVF